MAPASVDEPSWRADHMRRFSPPVAATVPRYGYFVNWDDNSFTSLKQNAGSLDAVIVEWLHATDQSGHVVRDSLEKEAQVRRWVAHNAPGLKLIPLVNNYNPDTKQWHGLAAATMLESPSARAMFATDLFNYASDGGYGGVVLDIEGLPASAQPSYLTLVRDLSAMFATRGLRVLVSVPATDPSFDYRSLADASDALILTGYDEHSEEAEPGPLAGQGWLELSLQERVRDVDPHKLIIGVGSYGVDWAGAGKGKEISVQEAWELLEESGAAFRFDPGSLNPTFGYVDDDDRVQHDVWYLDGVTGYNQIAAALAMRPAGLALWRLGTEDPSIWSAFGRGRVPDAQALKAISDLRSGYDVLYKGKGEVLRVTGTPGLGFRTFTFMAADNLITNQEIVVFPKSTTITRWGAREDKTLALTFDDGPDPTYTPKVLDILAARGVKATFFIVGANGALNADLLQRIHREGHDIGNHTFTHLNSAEASSEHLKFELNSTQRLLESTIGIRTKLFRPPFARDLEPQTVDGVQALTLAASLGYVTIGMNVDPKDWARFRADDIVARTLEGVRKGEGNVLLLHDAGGNRSPTVEALPQIIDRLTAEGYRFATIHDLLGLSRAEVMPAVAPDATLVASLNHAGFTLYSGLNTLISFLFQLGIILGTARLLWVGAFALVHARKEKKRSGMMSIPSFAVVIPAYNEEKVVCASVRALLASSIQDFKIIVVDDGSGDRTADVVQKAFADTERVSVVRKENAGKWSALNEGLKHTDAEVVVTLDADTVFAPDALELLVRHFDDPKVGAVAGAATVGNHVNLMTRMQALEYITNQNLDRRALEVVNGITVVPGSIGAWRRQALFAIGGFLPDTLAEDADATVRLERAGWSVVYEPKAMARTEAPETAKAFLRQRLRWMFGTLQVAYKNRDAVWRGRPIGVGIFGLPNILIFQFLFTLVAPVIDLVLLWSLLSGLSGYWSNPDGGIPPTALSILTYWAYFQLVETASAALAIWIDGKPDGWRLLPLIVLQRFCYRQLLYVTAVRVAAAALKGQMLGWGKLMRTGRVTMEPAVAMG
jgi:cellulose synthase/poly-beta-1,6-N-acetylglucosamine synthase-like glycosyltransferase/peptidoglycan/xylan/chitin deacetylase (PgdA/CDA1 family)/spore germination protein YaaH